MTPTDAKARKALPLFSGVLTYFPDALLAVAEVSRVGNDQHNPGQPLHWAKEKSRDEADALARHLLDAGTVDTDGVRHSAKVAWRALALLQREIDRENGYDYDPVLDRWSKRAESATDLESGRPYHDQGRPVPYPVEHPFLGSTRRGTPPDPEPTVQLDTGEGYRPMIVHGSRTGGK